MTIPTTMTQAENARKLDAAKSVSIHSGAGFLWRMSQAMAAGAARLSANGRTRRAGRLARIARRTIIQSPKVPAAPYKTANAGSLSNAVSRRPIS